MKREDAEAAIAKHGSKRKAAEALGCGRHTLDRALAGNGPMTIHPTKVGKTLTDFRAEFDKDYIVPKRIKEGLRKLGSGWEYEVAFAQLCQLSLADLGNYREQFEPYWCVIRAKGKRAWAGNIATAKAMKEMVG